MSGKTAIEWADVVWNPVTGCTKVSEGCRNCYAERVAKRFWGERKFGDVMMHRDRVEEPLHWRKPRRVFVNSMSDLFHKDVPFAFIETVFETMLRAHQHTFMILTKRPDRMLDFWCWCTDNHLRIGDAWPLRNVWLGVSVENQKAADDRIPLLLQVPAAVRFLSVEPMIGPVNLEPFLQYPPLTDGYKMTFDLNEWKGIDWVICGGESGPAGRPMAPKWVRALRDECNASKVPFFFKQWGEWAPCLPMGCDGPMLFWKEEDGNGASQRCGKKKAGRMLDKRTWDEVPGK